MPIFRHTNTNISFSFYYVWFLNWFDLIQSEHFFIFSPVCTSSIGSSAYCRMVCTYMSVSLSFFILFSEYMNNHVRLYCWSFDSFFFLFLGTFLHFTILFSFSRSNGIFPLRFLFDLLNHFNKRNIEIKKFFNASKSFGMHLRD